MIGWKGSDSGNCRTPRLEIVSRLPSKPRRAPPILFVHGAWHGAWCWEDNFLDYFADRGFACYALNLRGHGASRGARDVRFCRVRHFVDDLKEAVDEIGVSPILVGHSLGGFVVQKYLEQHPAELGVLAGSIPPYGGLRMIKRVIRAQPLAALQSNLTFSLRPYFSTDERVRKALFGAETSEEIVRACANRLQDDTIIGLMDYLLFNLVDTSRISTRMLVFGASDDQLIDEHDVVETGRVYGQDATIISGVGHDLMLDDLWERAAEAIAKGIGEHLKILPQEQLRPAHVA